jgi:hypothetical protein
LNVFPPRPFQTAVFTVVDRCWGSVAERLVQALVVVKRNIARQPLARVPHALIVSQIHLLRCDRPPQPLHTHVVQGPPAAIPTDADPSCLPPLRDGPPGALRPLVGVEDLWLGCE